MPKAEHESIITKYRNELHLAKEYSRKKEHLLNTAFDFNDAKMAAAAAITTGANGAGANNVLNNGINTNGNGRDSHIGGVSAAYLHARNSNVVNFN